MEEVRNGANASAENVAENTTAVAENTTATKKASKAQEVKVGNATITVRDSGAGKNIKSGVAHNHTKKLTKAQSDAVKAIDIVAKAIGRKVHIIDSAVGEVDGRKITANAFIDKETNEYYVPVHDVSATILYFALHENIHDIAKNNPEGFAVLQNIVLDELIKEGVDIDELFEVQEKLYPNEDANYWGEEIVANTVPVILADKGTRDAFIQRIIGADNDTRRYWTQYQTSSKRHITHLKPNRAGSRCQPSRATFRQ